VHDQSVELEKDATTDMISENLFSQEEGSGGRTYEACDDRHGELEEGISRDEG
jgi:hypothetical protein